MVVIGARMALTTARKASLRAWRSPAHLPSSRLLVAYMSVMGDHRCLASPYHRRVINEMKSVRLMKREKPLKVMRNGRMAAIAYVRITR